MTRPKRVTCCAYLRVQHVRGSGFGHLYIMCDGVWSRLTKARPIVFVVDDNCNYNLFKSSLSTNTTAAHPLCWYSFQFVTTTASSHTVALTHHMFRASDGFLAVILRSDVCLASFKLLLGVNSAGIWNRLINAMSSRFRFQTVISKFASIKMSFSKYP